VTPVLTGLAIGLLGSVHCVAMCGGIAGALSMALPAAPATAAARSLRQLGFSTGRVLSYTIAGAAAGGAGSLLAAGGGNQAAIALRVTAAVLLLLVGLYVGGWSALVTRVERAGSALWRRLLPLTRKLPRGQSVWKVVLLGSLWGWLPCGLVYSALAVAAASGTAASGAGVMLGFGLGTVPALLGLGAAAARLSLFLRGAAARRAAGAAVIVFAVWTLLASGIVQAMQDPDSLASTSAGKAACHGHGVERIWQDTDRGGER
jgi:sulfite exporter TauE/SafE